MEEETEAWEEVRLSVLHLKHDWMYNGLELSPLHCLLMRYQEVRRKVSPQSPLFSPTPPHPGYTSAWLIP